MTTLLTTAIVYLNHDCHYKITALKKYYWKLTILLQVDYNIVYYDEVFVFIYLGHLTPRY